MSGAASALVERTQHLIERLEKVEFPRGEIGWNSTVSALGVGQQNVQGRIDGFKRGLKDDSVGRGSTFHSHALMASCVFVRSTSTQSWVSTRRTSYFNPYRLSVAGKRRAVRARRLTFRNGCGCFRTARRFTLASL